MYHYIHNISIYSKTGRLEGWLKAIPAPEKSEYRFRTYDAISELLSAESDIIILDSPWDSRSIRLIHEQKKENALLIACVFPEELSTLSAADYKQIDDLWINPLQKESAQFYFSKIITCLGQENALRLTRKYLDAVKESLPFAMMLCDNDGTIQSINKSCAAYLRTDKKSVIGKQYDEVVQSVLLEHIGDPSSNAYEAKLRIAGNDLFAKVHKEPIYDIFNRSLGYFCIYVDETVEHKMQEEIIRSANTDYLTGLYNRRYLNEALRAEHGASHLCLMYLDLDNFKDINDRFGHETGDKTLIAVARILKEQFAGHLVFRLGGDEFLTIVPDHCTREKADRCAQNILAQIRNAGKLIHPQSELSASIGIVLNTDPATDFDELLRRGDAALYHAKRNGKNQYTIWSPEKDAYHVFTPVE